jgi:hypothetical protein
MDFQRPGANGRERWPTLAMQKVVGSSPIIRFQNPARDHIVSSMRATNKPSWSH